MNEVETETYAALLRAVADNATEGLKGSNALNALERFLNIMHSQYPDAVNLSYPNPDLIRLG